jgi:hypothetical protein
MPRRKANAMTTMSDLSGYVASTLVLLTFMTKDMRLLRVIAILSNVAFIAYGAIGGLVPVLLLHLLLLPLNVVRLLELVKSTHDTDRSILASLRRLAPARWRFRHRFEGRRSVFGLQSSQSRMRGGARNAKTRPRPARGSFALAQPSL